MPCGVAGRLSAPPVGPLLVEAMSGLAMTPPADAMFVVRKPSASAADIAAAWAVVAAEQVWDGPPQEEPVGVAEWRSGASSLWNP